jgi:lysyl endopeptidase
MNNFVHALSVVVLLTSAAWCAAEEAMSVEVPTSQGSQPLRVLMPARAKAIEQLELGPLDRPVVKSTGLVIIGESRSEALKGLSSEARRFRWTSSEGRFIAEKVVRSGGAHAMRVGLLVGELPEGLELVVADELSQYGVRYPFEQLRTSEGTTPPLVWTPVTSGESQRVSLTFSGYGVPPTVYLADVSHLFSDPLRPEATPQSKLLTCHRNYSCVTDTTIQSAGRAVAKLLITTPSGQTGSCSGALLNDRASSGTPWLATADHCGITTNAVASNLQLIWSYEVPCNSTVPVASVTTIGSQVLFTDERTDFTLLRIAGPMPSGLRFLGWNSADVPNGTAVSGIHHPAGVYKAVSGGNKASEETVTFRSGNKAWTIPAQSVIWAAGVTEPGSSGSPLISSEGAYRGSLSAVPRDLSCSTAVLAYYSRFSTIYPKIRAWIDPVQAVGDDWPDSAVVAGSQIGFTTTSQNGQLNSSGDQDWFKFSIPQQGVIFIYSSNAGSSQTNTYGRVFASNGTTLLSQNDDFEGLGRNFLFAARVGPGTYFLQVTGSQGATGPYVINSIYASDDDHSDFPFLGTSLSVNGPLLHGQISKAGDADSFQIDVPAAGTLNLASAGGTDVVGFLYDANFNLVADNDDVSYPGNLNFSISRQVVAGRYYLVVLGYDVTTRGSYSVSAQMAGGGISNNLTGLWWNPRESGWGINFNHQSDIVFGTLFTYGLDGNSMWLVASDMRKQADGSYLGGLYRARGPAYYVTQWSPVSLTQVGTMRVQSAGEGLSLQYSVDGIQVNKSIERQIFSSPVPTCVAGTASRMNSSNYQDLWWNPSESGWGINFAHQGNILFGTLFVYGLGNQDRWFVASGMTQGSDGVFRGDLFYTNGPAFNSAAWGSISIRPVGNISVRFFDGANGTLSYTIEGVSVTKTITRQVFAAAPPSCQ